MCESKNLCVFRMKKIQAKKKVDRKNKELEEQMRGEGPLDFNPKSMLDGEDDIPVLFN